MTDRADDCGPPRILHLHSTFAAGGKERRAVRLMNAFGEHVSHAVVSGVPGELSAANEIDSGVDVDYPDEFPALSGKPTPWRLQAMAQAMAGYDLVLTYNWGAMDAVMAHTLFGKAIALPPLIHHEDGFNADEQLKLKRGRNWYRRIALGRASGLVVPSETLEGIALTTWSQPFGRVRRIPNGIDTAAFAAKPKPDALRGVIKHEGELWVGTVAGLRSVKALPRLVRAFAALPEPWQLVIVGEGNELDAIRAEASHLGVDHRLHLPGFVPDPANYIGLFDIFALSSLSEQFPISLVEAMAAGLPAAAPAVGDIREMVAEENEPFIVEPGDIAALSMALVSLAADGDLRRSVGEANRAKARAEFDEAKMIAAYRRLYSSALGREIPA
ncbi:glycosyltransferase family 4 protein [Tsuneonella mangrovi]|uniref:glycosyltransferase family 4 protein n=1 Tax=Tsuneonella mangrovi TaxID=1982042 RepID=UPI000BA24ACB|nr:glycosyltransferase family 4 protein [Tsuneonella mangrovi]